MKRRDFISLLGGAVAAWPLAARAQQPAMPVVGSLFSVSAAQWEDKIAGFRRGLDEAASQATKNEPPGLAARSVKQGGVKVQEDGLTPPLMIEKP